MCWLKRSEFSYCLIAILTAWKKFMNISHHDVMVIIFATLLYSRYLSKKHWYKKYFFFFWQCPLKRYGYQNDTDFGDCRLSDVIPPLRSWVRALCWASDRTLEEFVNTLPKVVGFLRVFRFPPTRKVDRVGWN